MRKNYEEAEANAINPLTIEEVRRILLENLGNTVPAATGGK